MLCKLDLVSKRHKNTYAITDNQIKSSYLFFLYICSHMCMGVCIYVCVWVCVYTYVYAPLSQSI